jgi:hypothetical protein
VLSALLALRGTAIEPLGVVRRAKPIRRRLWWRLIPIVVGVAVLSTLTVRDSSRLTTIAVVVGVACLLVGVPALLPWLLERAVARLSGGRPAFQLAVRRLQLDSGTPARVVAGLAVVLAGAIALQSLLTGQAQAFDPGPLPQRNGAQMEVDVDHAAGDAVTAALAKLPGVSALHLTQSLELRVDPNRVYGVRVAGCATWRELAGLRDCHDGDVYVDQRASAFVHSGQSYQVGYYDGAERRSAAGRCPTSPR